MQSASPFLRLGVGGLCGGDFGFDLAGCWCLAFRLKHESRGGSRGWANLAKVAVVLGAINVVAIIWNSYIPQSAEMVRIIAGDKSIPAYTIRILPGGTEVEFAVVYAPAAPRNWKKSSPPFRKPKCCI